MTNKVEICGVNTSKLPVLSREEKNKLFIKIKNGDLQARETFVKGNYFICEKEKQLWYQRNLSLKTNRDYT